MANRNPVQFLVLPIRLFYLMLRVIRTFKHIKKGKYNFAVNIVSITEQQLTSNGRGKHGCKISMKVVTI